MRPAQKGRAYVIIFKNRCSLPEHPLNNINKACQNKEMPKPRVALLGSVLYVTVLYNNILADNLGTTSVILYMFVFAFAN